MSPKETFKFDSPPVAPDPVPFYVIPYKVLLNHHHHIILMHRHSHLKRKCAIKYFYFPLRLTKLRNDIINYILCRKSAIFHILLERKFCPVDFYDYLSTFRLACHIFNLNAVINYHWHYFSVSFVFFLLKFMQDNVRFINSFKLIHIINL